jgi:predicted kinase
LRYYKVYRALVRAKVANIRATQESGESQHQCEKERDRYLTLAASFIQTPMPRLAITHGFSGSGKTYGSQKILEEWGAIRLRTDVERKRMFGGGRSDVGSGSYTLEITDQVYAHLLRQSENLLREGYSVIVDGTFLKASQRKLFFDLAKKQHLSFQILDFDFPENILEERISKRLHEGQDASEADLKVLKYQQKSQEPLTEEELQLVLKNLLPQ